jgi:hypothetical protein
MGDFHGQVLDGQPAAAVDSHFHLVPATGFVDGDEGDGDVVY